MHSFKKITLFLLAAGTAYMTGCGQTGYKKTAGGLEYKIFNPHDGAKPKEGDILKVNIVTKVGGKNGTDTTLMNTYDNGGAQRVPFQKPKQPYDLMEGFALLSKGDSAVFVVPADSVMPAMARPPFIKDGDEFHITVKLEDIFTSQDQVQADVDKENAAQDKIDDQKIQDYMKKNNLQGTKTDRGVYVVVTQAGSGAKVDSGDEVTLNYTGKTLEGKTFDSNTDTTFHHAEPFSFPVEDNGGAIPGWIDGVKQLHQGAKATIIIPSSLAYGKRGAPPVITPNSVLVFDVDVLNVKKGGAKK